MHFNEIMSFLTVFDVAPIAGRMRMEDTSRHPGGLTYGVAYPGLIWHHRYAVPFRHSNNLELSSCPVLLAACIYTKKGGSRSGAS